MLRGLTPSIKLPIDLPGKEEIESFIHSYDYAKEQLIISGYKPDDATIIIKYCMRAARTTKLEFKNFMNQVIRVANQRKYISVLDDKGTTLTFRPHLY